MSTTSTTARPRRTTAARSTGTNVSVAASRPRVVAASTSSLPVPTTPPTSARFVTEGPGQSYSFFADVGTVRSLRSGAAGVGILPSGVWANTIGLDQQAAAAAGGRTTTAGSSTKEENKFPIIPVAAGAGGGLVLIIVLAVLICCCVKRRKARRESFNLRTQNLRNSLISPPMHTSDKLQNTYGGGKDPYEYTADYRTREPMRPPPAFGSDNASSYSRETSAVPPSRFNLSAQDRGYGSRQPLQYKR